MYKRRELIKLSRQIHEIAEDTVNEDLVELYNEKYEYLNIVTEPFKEDYKREIPLKWVNNEYRAFILIGTDFVNKNRSREDFSQNYDLNVKQRTEEITECSQGNNFKTEDLRYLLNSYLNEASHRGLDTERIKDDQKLLLMNKNKIGENLEKVINEIYSEVTQRTAST